MTIGLNAGRRRFLWIFDVHLLVVQLLLLIIVEITADPCENYEALTHHFFGNIYDHNHDKMREMIESLSSDKLINLLNMEYAPEGTEKQLTPLMLAIVQGDAEMAKILLEKGADPHRMCLRKINSDHNLIYGSPLWVAASFGHLDVCRVLLAYGSNVELGLEVGISPLMAACDAGHKEIAAFLVKNGAKIGRTDSAGNTALMSASVSGRLDIVRFLLSNGARIDQKNKNGKSAIDFAYEYGNSEIVYFLQAEQRKIAKHNDL